MNKYFTKIKTYIASLKGNGASIYAVKVSSKEKISFLEQLSNLLNSGIPILNGLKIINYQTKSKKIKNLIEVFIDSINKGLSLKEVFSKYPKIFSKFDISIIEMGELTGELGESIELIKDKDAKSRELKSKILGALIYPMVIMSLATIMIIVFMVYVIPKIQDMYKDARVNLPELTQVVINISNFLQKNLIELIIGVILFISIIVFLKNYSKTKIYFDNAALRIPLFGPLIKKKILSLFTSSLGTLLSRGVIINKSLETSIGTLENAYYEKELKKVISGVSKGTELSKLMGIEEISHNKENFLFPIELSSIVKIGEQTGRLPELLLKVSKKFNKEIDNIIKNLATAIEPIVIVVVGLIVGTIIMAIMLPFFNMVNVI